MFAHGRLQIAPTNKIKGGKVNEQIYKQKGYNPNRINNYHSTKLLVPRNGTNKEERRNIENRRNLLYNIVYVI